MTPGPQCNSPDRSSPSPPVSRNSHSSESRLPFEPNMRLASRKAKSNLSFSNSDLQQYQAVPLHLSEPE